MQIQGWWQRGERGVRKEGLDLSTRFRALTRLVCVRVCMCLCLTSLQLDTLSCVRFLQVGVFHLPEPTPPAPLCLCGKWVANWCNNCCLLFVLCAAWATSLVSTAINMRHMQHRNCNSSNNSNLPPTRLTALVDSLTGCKYLTFR